MRDWSFRSYCPRYLELAKNCDTEVELAEICLTCTEKDCYEMTIHSGMRRNGNKDSISQAILLEWRYTKLTTLEIADKLNVDKNYVNRVVRRYGKSVFSEGMLGKVVKS